MPHSRIWPLISTVLGALAWLPARVSMPSASLDGSWGSVLQDAARHSLQFGPEVVFTYGPLGFLQVQTFTPDLFWWTVVFHLVVGAACGLAMQAIVGNAGWPDWAGPIVLLALVPPVHGSSDIPFLLPLVLWPFLAIGSTRAREQPTLMLLSVVVGAVALVKFTTFVLAFALAIVLAVDDVARRGRLPRAAAIVASTVVVLWMATGQHLTAFPVWLRASVETASAYSEAMSTPVGPFQHRELLLFAVNAGALLALAAWRAVRAGGPRLSAAALPASLLLIVFVQFKLGFVRHDAHATVSMFLMPILGMLVASGVPAPVDRRRFRALAAVVLVLGFVSYAYGLRRYFDRLAPPEHYRAVYAFQLEAIARYSRPARLHATLAREHAAALAALRAELPLPAGDGTIDQYGHRQGLLLAHPVSYVPRPVFQSYGAYSEDLAILNRRHLEGERAPSRVLWDTQTMDHRYPSMDDGLSLPVLLTRYEVREAAGDLTLLERRSDARTIRFTPLSTLSTTIGASVPIPTTEAPVWAEVDVDLSTAGRLLAVSYKLAPIYLEVTTADGMVHQHRIMRPLARAGMLLSPLVRSRDEFIRFATGAGAGAGQRVTAIRVLVDWPIAYATQVRIRLSIFDVT